MSTKKPTADYDTLEARLTDPDRSVQARDVATGTEAADTGGEFLLREYGSADAIQRAMITPGRPRVGQAAGPSPTVRARITPEEYAAMKQLEQDTGRSQSDLVRQAVHQLLVDHKLVS